MRSLLIERMTLPGREALHNLLGRLDFVNRIGSSAFLIWSKLRSVAGCDLVVNQIRVFLKCLEVRSRTACCNLLIVSGFSR